jgi:hypothetical protein
MLNPLYILRAPGFIKVSNLNIVWVRRDLLDRLQMSYNGVFLSCHVTKIKYDFPASYDNPIRVD